MVDNKNPLNVFKKKIDIETFDKLKTDYQKSLVSIKDRDMKIDALEKQVDQILKSRKNNIADLEKQVKELKKRSTH